MQNYYSLIWPLMPPGMFQILIQLSQCPLGNADGNWQRLARRMCEMSRDFRIILLLIVHPSSFNLTEGEQSVNQFEMTSRPRLHWCMFDNLCYCVCYVQLVRNYDVHRSNSLQILSKGSAGRRKKHLGLLERRVHLTAFRSGRHYPVTPFLPPQPLHVDLFLDLASKHTGIDICLNQCLDCVIKTTAVYYGKSNSLTFVFIAFWYMCSA